MSTGPESKKRKKNYYKSFAKKRRTGTLEPEMTGFLVTFERSEFQAAKDCYELLNEYADKIWGPEKREETDSKQSIEDDLAAELNELKESKDKVRRFQKVKTAVTGNFFITTTVEDPGRLATAIFEDLKSKQEQRSRFVQRVLPVQTTCKAHLDTMRKTVEAVVGAYDDAACPQLGYLVAGKIRHNSSLQHNAMLQEIVEVVKSAKPEWMGELRKPDLVIMLDVLQDVCCISLMPRYLEFRKYNLLEVTKPQPKPETTKESDPAAEVPKDKAGEADEAKEATEDTVSKESEKPPEGQEVSKEDAVETTVKPDNGVAELSSDGSRAEKLNLSEESDKSSEQAEELCKA